MPTNPTDPSVRVRAATAADLDRLVAMMRLFHAGLGRRIERTHLRAPLQELLAAPALGAVLIGDAAAGAEPLGYAVLTFGFDLAVGGRDATLTELYVRPAARRRGVGRRLLESAESHAIASDARVLRLSLLPENEPAFELYRSFGYETPPRVLLSKDLATETQGDAR